MSTGTAFVYGTLMAEEVLKLLIRRVPPSKPATLSGYSRHRVKGQVFPAIIPAKPQDRVKGMVGVLRSSSAGCTHVAASRHGHTPLPTCLQVLMELTPSELHILDGEGCRQRRLMHTCGRCVAD
jgi:hypothetical protein